MEINPTKLVIYYDKPSGLFLVRLVDDEFNEVCKLDRLPALTRISDLYIKVIDIDSIEREEEVLVINDKYIVTTDSYREILSIMSVDKEYIEFNKNTSEDLRNIFEILI